MLTCDEKKWLERVKYKDDIVINESLGEAYFEANMYEQSISMFN